MSSDKTSVAVSRPLSERIKEFASSKGTTTSGVCEVILTAALSGEIPGAHDLGYPVPGKRGRKGGGDASSAETEPADTGDEGDYGDPLDAAEPLPDDEPADPETVDDDPENLAGLDLDSPEDLGFESDGT